MQTRTNTRWREAGHFIRNFVFDFQSTRFVAPPRTQRQVAALLTIAADPLHPQVSRVRAPGPPPRPTPLPLETDSSQTGPCLARPGAILSAIHQSASSRQRQHRDLPQHAGKQPPRQMALRQHQPVVARVFDEPSAGLHQPLLQAWPATSFRAGSPSTPRARQRHTSGQHKDECGPDRRAWSSL